MWGLGGGVWGGAGQDEMIAAILSGTASSICIQLKQNLKTLEKGSNKSHDRVNPHSSPLGGRRVGKEAVGKEE